MAINLNKVGPQCPGIVDAAKFGRNAKSLLRQRQNHPQRHTFGQILTRKAQLRKKVLSDQVHFSF